MLRKYNVNIDESCLFYNSENEDINYLLKIANFVEIIIKISPNFPILIRTNMDFIEWLENIWNNRKVYNKIFFVAIENIIAIV